MISPKMLRMTPVMIWTSISMAMVKGLFPKLLDLSLENTPEAFPKIAEDEELQDKIVFNVMGFLGIGQIVGGILMGFSRDACGNKCALIF